MFSAPPPTATSASPSTIVCAAETIACRPLPHRRLSVSAGVSTGSPPFTAGDAGEVEVVRVGVDDVAEHDVADVRRLDAGASHGLA